MGPKTKATLTLTAIIGIGALTLYSPTLVLGTITIIITGMLWNGLYKHYKEEEGESKKNKLV